MDRLEVRIGPARGVVGHAVCVSPREQGIRELLELVTSRGDGTDRRKLI